MVLSLTTTFARMEEKYSLPIFSKRGITIIRGEGAELFADNGTRYIDAIGGWGAANIGHGNKAIAKAIHEQAEKLISCPGILYNDMRAMAMEKLVEITPKGLNKVFFTNSGTESVEVALKMAMLSTGKSHIIAAMKGFHGRTIGSLQVTHKKRYRKNYSGLMREESVSFVPFNRIEAIEKAIRPETAAIILEIIQGEGGINIGDREYFQEVRRITHDRGIILIVDEVQTGFGRTGDLFAIVGVDIIPDILCLAKSIAGGFPMGAIITNNKIQGGIGEHGSTFGGNPLACAAFLASIKYIEDHDLVRSTREKGEYLKNGLDRILLSHPKVRSIRGRGLLIAIDLRASNQDIIRKFTEKGLLAIPTGRSTIRLLPPLVISYQLIDEILEIFDDVFN